MADFGKRNLSRFTRLLKIGALIAAEDWLKTSCRRMIFVLNVFGATRRQPIATIA